LGARGSDRHYDSDGGAHQHSITTDRHRLCESRTVAMTSTATDRDSATVRVGDCTRARFVAGAPLSPPFTSLLTGVTDAARSLLSALATMLPTPLDTAPLPTTVSAATEGASGGDDDITRAMLSAGVARDMASPSVMDSGGRLAVVTPCTRAAATLLLPLLSTLNAARAVPR
jgi:hypothetical protein